MAPIVSVIIPAYNEGGKIAQVVAGIRNTENIDNLGNVHPDTMWWHHSLGSVRERPFSAIWADTSDPLMRGLKMKPRPVGGRQFRRLRVAA